MIHCQSARGLPSRHAQRRRGHAGVVAQHVHATEFAVGRVGQGLHLGIGHHVLRHTDGGGAVGLRFGHGTRQRRGLDVGQHQLHARTRKAPRHRQADAAGGARDHGHTALKGLHARSSLNGCGAFWPTALVSPPKWRRRKPLQPGLAQAIGHHARPCWNCNT
jgi:hypothetical protein